MIIVLTSEAMATGANPDERSHTFNTTVRSHRRDRKGDLSLKAINNLRLTANQCRATSVMADQGNTVDIKSLQVRLSHKSYLGPVIAYSWTILWEDMHNIPMQEAIEQITASRKALEASRKLRALNLEPKRPSTFK